MLRRPLVGLCALLLIPAVSAGTLVWQAQRLTPVGSAPSMVSSGNGKGQTTLMQRSAQNPGEVEAFVHSDTQGLRPLGAQFGVNGEAVAINDRGDIAGHRINAQGMQEAVLWRDGQLQAVGLGGNGSQVLAMNSQGVVLGRGTTTSNRTYALVHRDGQTTALQLGGWSSQAQHLNARGDVAGTADDARGAGHAFFYRDGQMSSFNLGGGGAIAVRGLNDLGTVVGEGTTDRRGRTRVGFVHQGGQTRTLTQGGNFAEAADVNNRGEVAGSANTAGNAARIAFKWQDGQFRSLGTLGGRDSAPLHINEAGQVLGWSHTAQGLSQAFLWDDTKGLQPLTLGGMSWASQLSEQGMVIGQSYLQAYGGALDYFLFDGTQTLSMTGLLAPLQARSVGYAAFATDGSIYGTANFGGQDVAAFRLRLAPLAVVSEPPVLALVALLSGYAFWRRRRATA